MKPNALLVTGEPGIGKTTVCHRVIDSFDGMCRGIVTNEIRTENGRVGFEVQQLNGRTFTLSHVSFDGPTVGRYGVDTGVMDRVTDHLLSCINDAKTDLLVIDEIGKMELLNDSFKRSIKQILQSTTQTLATVPTSGPPPIPEIKQSYPIVEVTTGNRNQLHTQINHRFTRNR